MSTQATSTPLPTRAEFWKPVRLARMAIFIALAAVGALIKIPSPTGTVALDSAPGYFSAISFGWAEGGIVAACGHLLTAWTSGFSLGLVTHLEIAVCQFAWAAIFYWVAKKVNIWVSVALATFLNGVVGTLVVLPLGGWALFVSLLPSLVVGSAVNVILAALAYIIVNKSGLLKN